MVTIQQIPLEKIRGKRILVLIDPNIEKAARTLGSLIGKSAKLIVATHVGEPGGQSPTKLKLDFPKELSHTLGLRVRKLHDAVGWGVTRAVLEIKPGEIILLENLSLYPPDAANEVAFARQLASLCDGSSMMPWKYRIEHWPKTLGLLGGRRFRLRDPGWHPASRNWRIFVPIPPGRFLRLWAAATSRANCRCFTRYCRISIASLSAERWRFHFLRHWARKRARPQSR